MATESPAAPKAPRKPRTTKAAAPAVSTSAAITEPAAAPKKKAAAPRKSAAPKQAAVPAAEAKIVDAELASEVDNQEAVVGETPNETPVTDSLGLSTEERIRLAAYRRYEARGFVEGDPLEDWIEAEREVSR